MNNEKKKRSIWLLNYHLLPIDVMFIWLKRIEKTTVTITHIILRMSIVNHNRLIYFLFSYIIQPLKKIQKCLKIKKGK
jgi:hypothetical protein